MILVYRDKPGVTRVTNNENNHLHEYYLYTVFIPFKVTVSDNDNIAISCIVKLIFLASSYRIMKILNPIRDEALKTNPSDLQDHKISN